MNYQITKEQVEKIRRKFTSLFSGIKIDGYEMQKMMKLLDDIEKNVIK